MAKVSPQSYVKEQEEWRKKHGGGGDLPDFIDTSDKHICAVLSMAHVRGKKKGTWGVSALFMCVTGPQVGRIIKSDMWGESQIHRLIVSGFGYMAAYENGLPGHGVDNNDFDPSGELLTEMLEISNCADQKDREGKWKAGLPISARRSPYVVVTTQTSGYNEKYQEVKYVDAIKERGETGPYFISNYRDALLDKERRTRAINWFESKCEKMVREANEALAGSSRGGSDPVEEPEDDDIPF